MRAGAASVICAALMLALPALAPGASDTAAVYLTTPDGSAKLSREPDVRFSRAPSGAPVTVAVDPGTALQSITGFGAGLTDSSLWLLSKLGAPQREAALHRLLDPRTGIGLSVMRVPMGASDFTASGLYSYDDRPPGESDPTLAHFSVAHDDAYILPILRDALRVNPALRIVANPWSPPAWMKTNDSMLSLSPTGGAGRLRADAYAPLAQYFVRFIEAYRAAGVPIWAITPQNEPLQPTGDYPGMLLTPQEEATFVTGYLAPALRAARLNVRVYGYDYVWAGSEPYVATLLQGPQSPVLGGAPAAGAIDGIAYHCYFGAPESMSTLHTLYPGKDAIEDECSTGISLLSPIQVLLRSVDNWASAMLMWNVALDPSGGPKIGSGCVTCIGELTVNPQTGSVAYGGGFYELGQASSFVTRGARRIGASASPNPPACGEAPVCGLEYSAFHDPDGRVVVVATNSAPTPVTFAVRRPDGASFSYSLPGQSSPNGTDNSRDAAVVTFVWPQPAAGAKMSSHPARHRRHRRAQRRHRRAHHRRAARHGVAPRFTG